MASTPPNTIDGLVRTMRADPEMKADFDRDPMAFLESAAARLPNNRIYRMVVGALGVALLLSLVAAAWITIGGTGATIPDIFVTATSTIIGALAGLLAPQPQG